MSASGPLDTLLAVQAQEDSGERKRRQARRGQDLLDGLDRLKAALLSGRKIRVENGVNMDDIAAAAGFFADRGVKKLIITLGENGSVKADTVTVPASGAIFVEL